MSSNPKSTVTPGDMAPPTQSASANPSDGSFLPTAKTAKSTTVPKTNDDTGEWDFADDMPATSNNDDNKTIVDIKMKSDTEGNLASTGIKDVLAFAIVLLREEQALDNKAMTIADTKDGDREKMTAELRRLLRKSISTTRPNKVSKPLSMLQSYGASFATQINDAYILAKTAAGPIYVKLVQYLDDVWAMKKTKAAGISNKNKKPVKPRTGRKCSWKAMIGYAAVIYIALDVRSAVLSKILDPTHYGVMKAQRELSQCQGQVEWLQWKNDYLNKMVTWGTERRLEERKRGEKMASRKRGWW